MGICIALFSGICSVTSVAQNGGDAGALASIKKYCVECNQLLQCTSTIKECLTSWYNIPLAHMNNCISAYCSIWGESLNCICWFVCGWWIEFCTAPAKISLAFLNIPGKYCETISGSLDKIATSCAEWCCCGCLLQILSTTVDNYIKTIDTCVNCPARFVDSVISIFPNCLSAICACPLNFIEALFNILPNCVKEITGILPNMLGICSLKFCFAKCIPLCLQNIPCIRYLEPLNGLCYWCCKYIPGIGCCYIALNSLYYDVCVGIVLS